MTAPTTRVQMLRLAHSLTGDPEVVAVCSELLELRGMVEGLREALTEIAADHCDCCVAEHLSSRVDTARAALALGGNTAAAKDKA